MKRVLWGLLLAGIAAAVYFEFRPTETQSVVAEIEQTKTIRCGYMPYEPFVVVDSNTKALSGVFYDYLNQAAQAQGYRVLWTTETSILTVVSDLNARRFDALCIPASAHPAYEAVADFASFFGYMPYFVYARADDTRQNFSQAHFAAIEGFVPSVTTQMHFPKAQLSTLPNFASQAELYDQLRYKKADAVVSEAFSASGYTQHNPGVLRQVGDALPAHRMQLVVKQNEPGSAAFFAKLWGVDAGPENWTLMQRLMAKYGIKEDALWLLSPTDPAQVFSFK